MPQLMPMFWMFSVFMILNLIYMLMLMYYNKSVEMIFMAGDFNSDMKINMYMW